MADFKTALQSLANGELTIEVLSKRLGRLLIKSPHQAKKLLTILDEYLENGKISDEQYTHLKSQINHFRRMHSASTEDATGLGSDSTVFADDIQKLLEDTFDQSQELSADNSSPMSENNSASHLHFSSEPSLPSYTSATDASSAEWSDPSSDTGKPHKTEMGLGSIIKQRFKLLDILGIGGMGKVYKGVDLLKEEARDKNPYLAIKLLNDDFRDHPEAFISLQRESSRQQRLAHPNIATVYDFDRIGGPGTPVYITMELMEGIPLNEYIKKHVRKEEGLPFEQAFDIIRQLGSALSYAHDRGLVHSDFKPGNAFLCNDGTVKILDFGIARAVKNPVTGESEKTLFDPGKLGALTPAYASLEMLEGEQPDTRDDTYALGCVAYELLTGRHPFNKLPANKAQENNLLPVPVKGLKRRQNRALRQAVAFLRKDRCPTVDHFIEELEARYIWYKHPLTLTAILFIALTIGFTGPVINYFHKQGIQQIITDISNTSNKEMIISYLDTIKTMDKSDQFTILDEAKDSIQRYFSNKIQHLIDTSNENYNFIEANTMLDRISELYPESSYLNEQTRLVEGAKKLKLAQLGEEFSIYLKDKNLITKTRNIIDTIRNRIDPDHPLLADERPSYQFRILADDAFAVGNYERALDLVNSGLTIAPNDQQLDDTREKIQQTIRITQLEGKLEPKLAQLGTAPDFILIEDDIRELSLLDPGDPILDKLSIRFKKLIEPEIKTLLDSGNQSDSVTMVNQYAELLGALQLESLLIQIKLAHLQGNERQQAIEQILAENNSSIDELLASPMPESNSWKASLLTNVQSIDSLAGDSEQIARNLTSRKKLIATLFIQKARETLSENRFDAAESLIRSAESYVPEAEEIEDLQQSVNIARADQETKLIITGLKKDFNAQVEANKVVKALEHLDELKSLLPSTDDFIMKTAPLALANSYADLARSRFAAEDYINALRLVNEGLKYNPADTQLLDARQEYRVEANVQELTQIFGSSLSFDIEDIRTKFGEIESTAPGRYSEFRQEAITGLIQRINNYRTTDQNAAAALAQNAAALFPGTSLEVLRDQIKPQPWPVLDTAFATLNAGKLTEGMRLQEQQSAEGFSGHPDFMRFTEELSNKMDNAEVAYQRYLEIRENAGTDVIKLKEARRSLIQAQAFWSDNPEFVAADDEINQLIAANTKLAIIPKETTDLSAATMDRDGDPGKSITQKAWRPTSSGRECSSNLAGYGTRAKAICYDLVNDGWRGPLMVVIPGGADVERAYAISKYEISIGDYSKYCVLTGNCRPVTEKEKFDEPLTNISLADAEKYATWLSERTGKNYRIPNKTEWLYAANANGDQPRKDFNCRVTIGDKIIKGTGTVSIASGVQNGWGLKNYIGNVQEWVRDGGKIKAIGGAFEDAFTNCDTSLERAHNGNADNMTGFRLVQDDIS